MYYIEKLNKLSKNHPGHTIKFLCLLEEKVGVAAKFLVAQYKKMVVEFKAKKE